MKPIFQSQFIKFFRQIQTQAKKRWGDKFSVEIMLHTDGDYRISAIHTDEKTLIQECITFGTSQGAPQSIFGGYHKDKILSPKTKKK